MSRCIIVPAAWFVRVRFYWDVQSYPTPYTLNPKPLDPVGLSVFLLPSEVGDVWSSV